ncbi:MAG: ATP-grasp domain-containing protein, partial [Selenomonadaceae bacterium]|nr:ATP-grasp domain-containing protein [Selenomonadaceae bacterium]
MFKRILIANRGEIAVRVIRACQELGIETAVVFSDVDENSLCTQLADIKCRVSTGDPAGGYLDRDAILYAMYVTEADALHPGYGFLSEDHKFAEMITKAGFTWIGPNSETLELVGDKDAARASIAPSGIPMAKGSPPLTDNDMALEAAREVRYPVILKPVSGGGGKGMFIAHDENELRHVLGLVDVTKNRFYFEHYIERSRHIEVQIVADNFGSVIHLGERECSIQRRNQKLLEESPSVALTPEMRERVGKLAVKAAKSVHYSNIGTVEFLLDLKTNEFYFMEINPRIQVEHGITEAVTGIDLVRTQIKVASGEPLNFTQEDIKFTGHA